MQKGGGKNTIMPAFSIQQLTDLVVSVFVEYLNIEHWIYGGYKKIWTDFVYFWHQTTLLSGKVAYLLSLRHLAN